MSLDQITQRRVVLTGARKGHTGPLGNHHAVAGVITLTGTGKDIIAWEHHIEMMWQGYPMGDPRIEAAEKAIAEASGTTAPASAQQEHTNGQGDLPTSGEGPNGQAEVHGGVLAEQPGADQAAGQLDGSAQPSAGAADAGSAVGNGSPEVLTPEQHQAAAALANPKLARALEQLDPSVNDHWTGDGKPLLSVVEKFYGQAGLTRKDVDALTGGRKRPTAAA